MGVTGGCAQGRGKRQSRVGDRSYLEIARSFNFADEIHVVYVAVAAIQRLR